jgi:O-antigen biosynthesis protein
MANKIDFAVTYTPGLVSIVIPCLGMLEYTKLCVPSVLRHSRPPFELIFLDIGSLDGTAEFLAGLKMGLAGINTAAGKPVGSDGVRIHIERTPTDLGMKDACRRALQEARGEYIVLLNNDTVVTNGWLNQLIGLATYTMAIGLVGPMSNMAAPPQLVEPVPYRSSVNPGIDRLSANGDGELVDVPEVESFALSLRKEQQGNWLYAERLGGFCVLMKREVLDKVGPVLDEWSDLRLFDSDILSSKASQKGFSMAVCRDLFVHHFGTRMFAHGSPKTGANSTAVQA